MWVIRTDLPDSAVASLGRLLDADERERAEAFGRPEMRARFIAAHGAVRVIVGGQLGIAPELVRWRADGRGKPELANRDAPKVSTSRSGELAALALAPSRRVGVDVQRVESGIDVVRMAGRFYPAAEAGFVAQAEPAEQVSRFLRLWARKEACVKAGGGLLLAGLRLETPTSGVVSDPGGPLPGPYLVRDIEVPAGFHGSVAVAGEEPFCLRTRDWPEAGYMLGN